ncbi:hypothetical protein NPIL_401231 [Nephila pilipes]|uniref:Uncharacterized protein n=1 Tax=Nephila pilipes TaxID=299642 RepID=A0A8X6TAX2_NEPPI|nr:hypothetical protein NPIL_401231 [Nephila pilipes]
MAYTEVYAQPSTYASSPTPEPSTSSVFQHGACVSQGGNSKNDSFRNEMNGVSKKKIHRFSEEYLKFGFIPAVYGKRLPFCL